MSSHDVPDPLLEMAVDELCNLDTQRDPTDDELLDIYCWIDHLTFSRPKRNISRDFSDGVLMAELIHQYLPSLVNLGNFSAALSKRNKVGNWDHLNAKVLCKLGYKLDKDKLNDLMDSKAGVIEKVLFELRPLIARRNRSILNYRKGGIPAAKNSKSKFRAPVAMTQAFDNKRRPKAVPIPKPCPPAPKPQSQAPKPVAQAQRPQTQASRPQRPLTQASRLHSTLAPKPQLNASSTRQVPAAPAVPQAKSKSKSKSKINSFRKDEVDLSSIKIVTVEPINSTKEIVPHAASSGALERMKSCSRLKSSHSLVVKDENDNLSLVPANVERELQKYDDCAGEGVTITPILTDSAEELLFGRPSQAKFGAMTAEPSDNEDTEAWTIPELKWPTGKGNVVFEEDVLLAAAFNQDPTAMSGKQSSMKIHGIPGVNLGYYGLV